MRLLAWRPCRTRPTPFRRCRPGSSASARRHRPCSAARPRWSSIAAPAPCWAATSRSRTRSAPRSWCRSAPRTAERAGGQRRLRDFCRMITDAVAKGGFDGSWLDLHGAMVTEGFEDGEGELLRRIRAIDPRMPSASPTTCTPTCSTRWSAMRTVVAGYQTYPHIDNEGTAERAGARPAARMRRENAPPAPGAPRRCCRT